jgi:hypothetical protein
MPFVSITMALLLIALSALIAMRFACFVLAIAGILATVRIALGD